jgi:8-oxo-dGTP pyrophosphatase MutT (NUDIX family)
VNQLRVPIPPSIAEHAQRFLEGGVEPVASKLAATVILMRTESGFEVFGHRRARTMAFAPSMYAFPGGSVDPRDSETTVGWAGPDPQAWGARLGLDAAVAQALLCGAVREVFEECGVLLAGPSESTVVGDVSGDDWEAARLALLAREVAIAELLESRGLLVRSDLLFPWARWLTPEFEPRRFDTYFFLARMPEGQRTRDVGGESDHAVWAAPAVMAELPMLPPTRHNLLELAAYADLDGAIAASEQRDLTRPLMPRAVADAEGTWLVL